MKVGMVQSNYIPWRGYFDFIDDVDVFVFYDDVQYTPRDWRNRNLIKSPTGPRWLSVPVHHSRTTIVEVAKIDYRNRWIDKHIRSLRAAYGRTPYFIAYSPEFFDILASKLDTISLLNVTICRWLMGCLRINTEIRMSSEFNITGSRTDRPLAILRAMGATSYLSGPSAAAYTSLEEYTAAGIGLEFKEYVYPAYPQSFGTFSPNVTVLDLLFNMGPESRFFMKSLTSNRLVVHPSRTVADKHNAPHLVGRSR